MRDWIVADWVLAGQHKPASPGNQRPDYVGLTFGTGCGCRRV